MDAFTEQLALFIEREINEFFGVLPDGLFFVLETSDERSGAANFTGNSSCCAIFYAAMAGTRKSALLRISGGTAIIFFWIDGRWSSLSIVLPTFSGKQRCFLRYARPIWKAKCMSHPIPLLTPRGATSTYLNFSPCRIGIKSSGFFQRSEPC